MLMTKKIIITIDGFSSCGKSTLAKDLAKKLNYRYIDTGAMYRAVTLYLLRKGIALSDLEAIDKALASEIKIDFDYDKITGKQITILNDENVESEIRSPAVADQVSAVSAIKNVRVFLVKQQQALGLEKGIVMDGRDIGTVVFPQAELKLFLTADEQIRAQRRFAELQGNGIVLSLEEVLSNLQKRDYMDSNREESPLRKADDAIVLDNSYLTQEEQVNWVLAQVESLI